MRFFVDKDLVDIPDTTEPYGIGTEGQVYKIGDEIFKLYFYDTLDEGYGNKYYFHKDLKELSPKQIALPKKLIFDMDGNYVGYTAHFVEGNVEENDGISLLPSEVFIDNLRALEEDVKYLSDNFVLMADVSPWNAIFDKRDDRLFLIDPGRYQTHIFDHSPLFSYQQQNTFQVNLLIGLLLSLDFKLYNPLDDQEASEKIANFLAQEASNRSCTYRQYFEDVLDNQPNVYQYVKSLKTKI